MPTATYVVPASAGHSHQRSWQRWHFRLQHREIQPKGLSRAVSVFHELQIQRPTPRQRVYARQRLRLVRLGAPAAATAAQRLTCDRSLRFQGNPQCPQGSWRRGNTPGKVAATVPDCHHHCVRLSRGRCGPCQLKCNNFVPATWHRECPVGDLDCRFSPGWRGVTVSFCALCVAWWVGVAGLRRRRASLLRGWLGG
jgi:hypothetical protein